VVLKQQYLDVMSNYRRAKTTGATYFFTVVTHNRKPVFRSAASVQILRDAFQDEMQRRPYIMEAAVILPDHLHCIWQLPENDSDYSSRWREIKKAVTKQIARGTKNSRGEGDVWQRRFWEHQIRDNHDWRKHIDYIHYNPVKHGYTSTPLEWQWSSFRRWVDKGAYSSDWGSVEPEGISNLNFE